MLRKSQHQQFLIKNVTGKHAPSMYLYGLCRSTWVFRPGHSFDCTSKVLSARCRPSTRGSCRPSWWSCTTERNLSWKTCFFAGRKLRNNGLQSIIDSNHGVSVYPCCCKSPVGQRTSIWADLVWILIGNVSFEGFLGFLPFSMIFRGFSFLCDFLGLLLFQCIFFREFPSLFSRSTSARSSLNLPWLI